MSSSLGYLFSCQRFGPGVSITSLGVSVRLRTFPLLDFSIQVTEAGIVNDLANEVGKHSAIRTVSVTTQLGRSYFDHAEAEPRRPREQIDYFILQICILNISYMHTCTGIYVCPSNYHAP